MRTLLILFLFLTGAGSAFSQKVRVSKGVIYVDDMVYATVKESGIMARNFSFRTPRGQEFMMMNKDEVAGDYIVTFFPSEQQTRLPASYGYASVMAKEIVDNEILKNGQYNASGERRFLLAHPSSASPGGVARRTSPAATGSVEQGIEEASRGLARSSGAIADGLSQAGEGLYQAAMGIADAVERAFDDELSTSRRVRTAEDEMVTRSRLGRVAVSGTNIQQSGITIGRYSKETNTDEGRIFNVYSFYMPSGRLVGVATVEHVGAKSYDLVTTKDNKTQKLSLSTSTEFEIVREIAEYLVKQRYL